MFSSSAVRQNQGEVGVVRVSYPVVGVQLVRNALSRSRAMGDQVLGVGDQDIGCLCRYFFSNLRAQLIDEVVVDRVCVLAVVLRSVSRGCI